MEDAPADNQFYLQYQNIFGDTKIHLPLTQM